MGLSWWSLYWNLGERGGLSGSILVVIVLEPGGERGVEWVSILVVIVLEPGERGVEWVSILVVIVLEQHVHRYRSFCCFITFIAFFIEYLVI